MIFFDFWSKLDLNIFNKIFFEIMIFFHFFYFFLFFSILKKNRLKKDSCFNFLKLKKKITFEKKKIFFYFWNKLDLNIFNNFFF